MRRTHPPAIVSSSSCRVSFLHEFLNAHASVNFGNVNSSILAHGYIVRPDKLPFIAAVFAEGGQYFAVQVDFQDARVVEFGGIRIRPALLDERVTPVHHVREAVAAYADGPRTTEFGALPLAQVLARGIEDLDARIAAVGHVYETLTVEG